MFQENNKFSFSALPSIVPFSFGSETVNQGKRAQLFCVVNDGDPPFKISWSMQGKDMSSDISISTTQLGSSASMLSIESVDYTHSGTFTCKVSNEAGYVTHTTELKVNGIPPQQVTGKLLIEKIH